MMKNIAVISAGGTGNRIGGDRPKQLRHLPDGRTVLQTCIDAFRTCRQIDEIIVVMHPDWIDAVPTGVHVVAGGKERWESSWLAIQAIEQAYTDKQDGINILLHDCARPFVTTDILERVCRALEQNEAVTVAIPATDTIYHTPRDIEDGHITLQAIPPRADMMCAQTPQAFCLPLLRQAYRTALQDPDGIHATDDAGVVLRYMPSVPITVVMGDSTNRKITFAGDLRHDPTRPLDAG